MYRQLDPQLIVSSLERLVERIANRFPNSGLSGVARELLVLSREAVPRSTALARPIYPLKAVVWSLIVFLTLVALVTLGRLDFSAGLGNWAELLQTLEAGIQSIVFIGIAIFFLVSAEIRIKRRRVFVSIRELRSIAHVVDMHQLTKDPEVVLSPDEERTPGSLTTRRELAKYLDYSSELLSITSKVAALYAQHLDDARVLSAVNELEDLTTGLSRKVWQKIMILDSVAPATVSRAHAEPDQ